MTAGCAGFAECPAKIEMSVFPQFRNVSAAGSGGGGREALGAAQRPTVAAVLRLLGRPRFFEINPAAPARRNAFNNRHTWRSLRPNSCAAARIGRPPRSTSRKINQGGNAYRGGLYLRAFSKRC